MKAFAALACGSMLAISARAQLPPQQPVPAAPPAVTSAAAMQSWSRFGFALIGDVPYSRAEETALSDLLRSIDVSSARFAIHVGDMKSASEPCSDDLLGARHDLLNAGNKPLVFVPGDNEWTDCGRTSAGGYDPVERLNRLRELFWNDDTSLGQSRIALVRQSDMARFRGYPENVRWQAGRVLFVGLNVPGSNNNFRMGGGRNGEFEDRAVANRVWLERAFNLAVQAKLAGIVIAVQADPGFEHPLRAPDRRLPRRDGYYEFKMQLRELAGRFKGQVLLLHGDSHKFRDDHPLSDATGKTLKNFRRVECFGSPLVSNWVYVEVDPRDPRLFKVSVTPALEVAEPPKPQALR